MEKNNAKIIDPSLYIQSGINPKTGLPLKMTGHSPCVLKDNIRKQLRIMDEQTAIRRYVWTGLPSGLTSDLIERILYYRGQGMFFFLKDKFYFLPYALSAPENSTGIDVYGRFTGVTPLPFNGTSNDGGGKDKPWIQGLRFEPVYDTADIEELAKYSPEELRQVITGKCVLLHDYTPQISQTNIPRQVLQDPLLDVMAECIPFMRTALVNSTGVMGLRVGNENENAEVDAASNAINKAALEGRKYVGITGTLDFQELTGGQVAKAEEFMLALQSLDNYRLSLYGLGEGGVFQKKSHMLEAEQEMNAGNVGLIADDGLENRQWFAAIVNTWFGLEMDCHISETVIGVDMNGDGYAGGDGEGSMYSAATQSNTGGEEE